MKKMILFLSLICTAVVFIGCKETVSVDINYGDSYFVNSEKLNKYENISWESNDDSIASVNKQGEITGNSPGTALLVAKNDDKIVAEYTVNVNIVPITDIVLSTDSTEIVEDDGFQLNYTLFPDKASDYGLVWKSADENIAVVNKDGYILAVSSGQTNISISNDDGIMAVCSVTVRQKPAYDRLSSKEKDFVDCALKYLNDFKDPSSVKIVSIECKEGGGVIDDYWAVSVNAKNGFGGAGNEHYLLMGDVGFFNFDDYNDLYSDIDTYISVNPDDSYNISLINEAIDEKR